MTAKSTERVVSRLARPRAQTARQAAVIGGNRIPFARSNGPYFEASNQDMLTATLDGLAARFRLGGGGGGAGGPLGLGRRARRRGRRRRGPQTLARLQPDAGVRHGQRVRLRDTRLR